MQLAELATYHVSPPACRSAHRVAEVAGSTKLPPYRSPRLVGVQLRYCDLPELRIGLAAVARQALLFPQRVLPGRVEEAEGQDDEHTAQDQQRQRER